jgi:hypothetical protein
VGLAALRAELLALHEQILSGDVRGAALHNARVRAAVIVGVLQNLG